MLNYDMPGNIDLKDKSILEKLAHTTSSYGVVPKLQAYLYAGRHEVLAGVIQDYSAKRFSSRTHRTNAFGIAREGRVYLQVVING